MIDKFYKNFSVRDYMNEEMLSVCLSNNIIDCSLGTNPFIENSIIKQYIEESNYEINEYTTKQHELLKEELLKFLGKYISNTINKDNIALGYGTMGLLRNICEFLINTGTKVLGCAPQFPRFISEVELKKGIYKAYKLEKNNNYRFITIDFIEEMDSSFDVISIENPNNPTGQIIDINDIEKIIKKAKQNESIVIVDEAYGDYMPLENSAIKLINKYDNLIVLRSASKFYGLANHRVGYMFASKELIKIYNVISIPFPFSDLSASVFIKILRNYKEFEITKLKVVEVNKKIYQALKKENYLYTNIETPIFTIKSNKYQNLTKRLMKEGVISEDCGYFMNLDETYSRIRISNNYEKLIEILLKVL